MVSYYQINQSDLKSKFSKFHSKPPTQHIQLSSGNELDLYVHDLVNTRALSSTLAMLGTLQLGPSSLLNHLDSVSNSTMCNTN